MSPAGRQGHASNRESSAAREFLGVVCALVAVGSELDLSSSSSTNQLGGLGSPNLSLCPHMFNGYGHILPQDELRTNVGLWPHQGHVFNVAA